MSILNWIAISAYGVTLWCALASLIGLRWLTCPQGIGLGKGDLWLQPQLWALYLIFGLTNLLIWDPYLTMPALILMLVINGLVTIQGLTLIWQVVKIWDNPGGIPSA